MSIHPASTYRVRPSDVGAKGAVRPWATAFDDNLGPLPAPVVSSAMEYGLVGRVMKEATEGTEVHPAAAGLAFLTFAGVSLGRTRYVRIGNDLHHTRIYGAHVARTSVGGKGMAIATTRRIRCACERGHGVLSPICGNYHDGGLSSREGLAYAIRDPSDELGKDGNPTDPGVTDKRLFVIEEEFANVLEQSKRDGNTLSAALRTAWDGGDLAPLTKTNRTRATAPHIGIHACITPGELAVCLQSREITNGFANRFLFVFGERQGIVPFPRTSPDETINGFAKELQEAIAHASFGGAVEASEDARAIFRKFYCKHRRALGLPRTVRVLIERHPPYAWRLALIFALLDRADTITDAHMRAAIAWLAYCRESVIRIFSTATMQATAEEAGDLVQRMTAAIKRNGGKMDREPLRVALGKPAADLLDAAIEQAELAGLLDVTSTKREGGGRPTRSYSIKRQPRLGRFARFDAGPGSEQAARRPRFGRADGPEVRESQQVAANCDASRLAETQAQSQTAQTAQTATEVPECTPGGTQEYVEI